MTITLYDIPSSLPGNAWSPNTFKPRVVLNFKGIPYKSEWVEYPDIEGLCKKIGAPPTSKKADGQDHYTLPVISDSATGKVVADSFPIAEYLEETYPNTPTLFPAGTRAAIALFEAQFHQLMFPTLLVLLLDGITAGLNPPSSAYFRTTREESFKAKIEEIAPPGPKREELWAKIKEGLTVLAGFYEKNGDDKLFFLGDTFSYADAIIVSFLVWTKVILGPNNPEWKAVTSWNGGRWGKLVEATEKYVAVD